ncbi:MAG: hypothetical protein JWQ87_1690 [Candidatus Sulfotelmatobacter sp.]|nr:hypothetical protein [Candidatus Sulfotelmatobacter sp.]
MESPVIDFQPAEEAQGIDFQPVDSSSPPQTRQQSSADIDSITRPQSLAPVAPSSANLSIRGPREASPHSIAEGLTTEQQERRGGMPLAVQWASGSLDNPHSEQVAPVPLSTQRLSSAGRSTTSVDELAEAPTPSGRFTSPPVTPAQAEADIEGPLGIKTLSGYRGPGRIARGISEAIPTALQPPPTSKDVMRGASDIIAGAGETATLPMVASGITQIPRAAVGIAGGYLASKGAKTATKALGGGAEAQKLAEEAGYWLPAAAGTLIRPAGGVEISPDGTRAAGTVLGGQAGAGVAVTPEAVTVRGKVGPFEGSKTFSRGPKASVSLALEPPTIESQPPSRAELADYLDKADYDPVKARAMYEADQGAVEAVSTAKAEGYVAKSKPVPTPEFIPPRPQQPPVIDFQSVELAKSGGVDSAGAAPQSKNDAANVVLPEDSAKHGTAAKVQQAPTVSGTTGGKDVSGASPIVLSKGDPVTLPDGRSGEVKYVSPQDKSPVVTVSVEGKTERFVGTKEVASLGKPEESPRLATDIATWQPPPELGAFSAPDHGATARADTERRMGGALTRSSAEVAPGKVGEMKVSDLRVAPHKFQYKAGTDAAGTSTLLKEAQKYNPELAGTISVWRDPADGKTYVVNGHHRYELAKRMGEKAVAVRHVVAKDAIAARAIGATQNIAEGRGTALDAAKFFRDSGMTAEDLKAQGISLGEAMAADGLALSRLDDSLFKRVVSGDLRVGRAKTIGEATADGAEQKAILSLVEKKEARGAKVPDDTLSELIRMVKGSEQTTETTQNLFGTQEITRSLALEKAEISAHIKQQLAKDKKLFGFVSKGDRATELERGGNKIDVDKSKEISTGAAQAEEVYNKLSERGGPISSILDESARRLVDGDNAGTVKSEAYQQVRGEVSKTLAGSEAGSAGRSERAPKPTAVAEAGTRQQESPVEPTLPGMEQVPAERAEANAEQQGRDLTEKLAEPPKSIESKAGEIEQKSPLFRDTEANPQKGLFADESGSFTPAALTPSRVRKTYDSFINEFIDKKLDLGDKYRRVADHDPVIARMLKEKDNAPRYFHDKAESNVEQSIKGLNESQVRLTAMMVDSQAREFLEANHPDQFLEAESDPAVMDAVKTFKQYQDQLAALRVQLGWHVRRDLSTFEDEDGNWQVLDQDGNPVEAMGGNLNAPEIFKSQRDAQAYVDEKGTILDHLKRTYPEHSHEPLMGTTNEGPSLGASYGGIKPPKPDKKQRLASAQYFYDHGAKDFSGYIKSYTQAYHAALNQKIYESLTDEATPWKEGTARPPQIEYRGKTYYSPDVAKSMKLAKPENRPKKILEYRAYDPAKDDKAMIRDFENGWSTQTTGRPGISPLDRYLAPKDVVDALEHYDMTRGVQENDSIRRFFQDQIVGLFGPNIHVLNIMRRLAQVAGTGAWDPRVWPYYQKLFLSKDLRERMADGLADDGIDALSKWGTYTNTRDVGSMHSYFMGNLNPANWVRQTIGKFSKGVLFDPKFMGGFGGLDQKSRVLAYDILRDQYGMGEEEAAKNVEDGFGNYNKANWTERMKRWARALLFPGWDFSSLKWFLRHPIKTALAPALVTMAANLAINKAGKNKDGDKYDFAYIHYGDRKFRSNLITESMALHIVEPVLEAGKAALQGGDTRDIAGAAGQGVLRGGGGLAGNLRPEIGAAAELLSNRQYMGGTKEIWKPEDRNIPGKVLPTRMLDKMLAFTVVKALPSVNRFLDSSYDNVDLATGAGSIVGVTNYKSGAEERLKTNEAKAMGYSQTLSTLAEREPEAAEKFVQDPGKAPYLMFNKDFSELGKDLKSIDTEIERVKMAEMKYEDRRKALDSLKSSRSQLLQSADALDEQLSLAKMQMKRAVNQ